jgi:hypothetical protein
MIPRTGLIRMVIAAAVSVGTAMTAAGCITRVREPSLSPSKSVSVSPGTSPTEPGPAPSITQSRGPTASQLQQVLLTPADLSGFTTGQDSGDGGSSPGCPALDSDFSAGSIASAEVLLINATSGVSIRERLRQFSESGARAVVARIREVTTSCATFTGTEPTLGKIVVTVTALSQPAHGDETTALRLTMKPESIELTFFENLVAVRHGGILLLITHGSPITIDNGLTASATGKAYTKMAASW